MILYTFATITYILKLHTLMIMNTKTLAVGLALVLAGWQPLSAQFSLVNPVPRQVSSAEGAVLHEAPAAWAVVADASLQQSAAWTLLQSAAVKPDAGAPFTLTLGLKGQKAVKKYAKLIPSHAEGYYLSVSPRGAVVAAADEAGLYYGLQSLLLSLSAGKLQEATVTDWPDVPFRGTVEGFYGTPWSHKARLSQIEFYGRHKMNVYIYGPKDDPYHRNQWRLPYPDDDARRIQELNEHAKQHSVKFYWAIHPGVDIKWTVDDRDYLMAKLEKMYALGIRAFAVFFDDIWGEGAKADRQAELLNYVDDHFIKKYHDVEPLILCPTEYNRAWADDAKGYLRTLGRGMNKDIHIMWTGNTVVHCIDRESMEWINERIDRKAYIWWNFPVSDFVRDHILLGPAYGNDLDIASTMSGFVSNPMEHAEASKISLLGIADYCWNMKAYDYQKDWELGLAEVLPGNREALRTFALYNKDLGPNGHGFRREEGDELLSLVARVGQGEPAAIVELRAKALELGRAARLLLGDKSNAELHRELRPWLLQGCLLSEYGTAICDLALASRQRGAAAEREFEALYKLSRSINAQMYELENSDVRHALQPGIKVGTKALLPTLNKLFTASVDAYNAAHATALENNADYNPFRLDSDVPQLKLLPVSVRGNDVSIAPSLEVINWPKDASLTRTADRDITFAGVDFNLGVPGVAQHFRLELFTGGQWREVSLLHYADNDPVIHTGNELGGMTAGKLRLTNKSGRDLQVYFRHFKFVKQ